ASARTACRRAMSDRRRRASAIVDENGYETISGRWRPRADSTAARRLGYAARTSGYIAHKDVNLVMQRANQYHVEKSDVKQHDITQYGKYDNMCVNFDTPCDARHGKAEQPEG
ncbi:unnamed protein product, partial [Prorocentrum cordatum]